MTRVRLSREERKKLEHDRVKAGQLHDLGRLILHSNSNGGFTLMDLNSLKQLPVGLDASTPLTPIERSQERTLPTKKGEIWKASIFARIEKG